jgi:hypothetical protein
MVTATEAWDILHTTEPGLFEEANLDLRRKLKPGLTIVAEVVRRDVRCAMEFEVIRKGKIKFIHEDIPNVVTWADIHTHFSSIDERIPHFECYINEENRPYPDNPLLSSRLADGIEIPDTTRGYSGAAGGISRGGLVLPPTVFPAKPIDISEGKIQGGKKGQVGDSDSSSDSQEDEEGDDTHELHKLAQPSLPR